jgi:hypothetical protein
MSARPSPRAAGRRRAARSVLAALALLLALATAAPSAGDILPPQQEDVAITQQLVDRDGNPWLIADFAPDGALATPSWAVCPPGAAACTPAGVTDQSFRAGPTPVGTTFEASATHAGTTYRARSDAWLGAVAATAPPTLSGTPRVGAVVTPHAGAWTGGWGGEFDQVHVEACRTREGRGCTTIAHPRAVHDRLAARPDPRWSGYWLFALDERYPRNTAFPAILIAWPNSFPPTPPGPTVARSAPLGPVAGPALRLRAHPLLQRDGRLLIGRATCARRCRVAVHVLTGRRSARASFAVRDTRALTVPAAGLRLARGAIVRVRIAGTPLAQAFVPPHGVVAAAGAHARR